MAPRLERPPRIEIQRLKCKDTTLWLVSSPFKFRLSDLQIWEIEYVNLALLAACRDEQLQQTNLDQD